MNIIDIQDNPLSEGEIAKERKAQIFAAAAILMGFALVAVGIRGAIAYDEDLLLGVAFAGFALTMVAAFFPFGDFDELKASDCGPMHDLCAKTPEGQAYRQKVLEQGRRFVVAEYRQMGKWVAEEKNRESCKKLYGIGP